MRFEVSATRHFSAAHAIKLYDGAIEPNHGHNWKVRVTVESAKLDSIGLVMDFHELERRIDAIVTPLHNNDLNRAPLLAGLNPSAENVAVAIGKALQLPEGVALKLVEVWETDDCRAAVRY